MKRVRSGAVLALVVAVAGAAVTWSIVDSQAAVAEPSLRARAAAVGLRIGSAVDATALAQQAGYRDRLGTEFSSVTTEDAMKWGQVEPARGQFDWAAADSIVDFAAGHDQQVRGHALVWHRSLPGWLTAATFTPDELRAILKQHIEDEVGRYAGRVAAWDVVNEAFNADGTLRQSIWLTVLGPGYIADAFRWARAADPTARLYLNEYGIERTNVKSNALYALVRDLRAQGVPIDGVGFQAHGLLSETPSGLSTVLTRVASLGVYVAITELDVRVPLPATAAKLATQAEAYGRAVTACRAVLRCDSITVWGFTDAYSWIPAGYPGYGAATLLDEQLNAKPAYQAVASALDASAAPNDPVGWWPLDDPAGGVAVDASGGVHPATVRGQLGVSGRTPTTTAFLGNGQDTEASTTGPVLHTEAGFTVSAWVRLTDMTGTRTVASQDGTARSAFYLQYHPTYDRWTFQTPSADAQTVTWSMAKASTSPALNTWTHLTGVYDSTTHELRLYVNGTLDATTPGVTTWPASGPFHIGRSSSGSRFAGAISDVRAWNRPLAPSEVAALADLNVGRWRLDGDTGDSSVFGSTGTAAGPVAWTADRGGVSGAALALDGTSGVDVPHPVVFTDRSFTASAWVKLTDKATARTVATQDGTVRGAFYLQYHPTYDRWVFQTPSADTQTVTWSMAKAATSPALNTWTHLTGVYDSTTHELRLYVNGFHDPTATATGVTTWAASGPFHIGRSSSGSRFTGTLDDVRAFSSALSPAQVTALSA